MKYIFIVLLIILITANHADAQGCVAIRSNGSACTMLNPHHQDSSAASSWTLGLNTRYFKSYRHFVGKEEQKYRVENGSEVINHAFSTEIAITKVISTRWSFSVYAPLISNTRSSLYEHDGKNRATTKSVGIGDMRMAAYFWVMDPTKDSKFNLQLGAGIKLPTGDYRYTAYFQKNDSTRLLGPVDQSIQLGDGGTGLTTEFNAIYSISKKFGLYGNGFYLLNPREQNGVSTARGGVPSAAQLSYGSDVMSVPDQYMVRFGGNIAVQQFTFSAGMRMECVPAKDLVGGSNGFRRPGYVLAVEPVVSYHKQRVQVYVAVPYAVERNRTQSIPDQIRTQKTGKYYKGDAAFADYSFNCGVVYSMK